MFGVRFPLYPEIPSRRRGRDYRLSFLIDQYLPYEFFFLNELSQKKLLYQLHLQFLIYFTFYKRTFSLRYVCTFYLFYFYKCTFSSRRRVMFFLKKKKRNITRCKRKKSRKKK